MLGLLDGHAVGNLEGCRVGCWDGCLEGLEEGIKHGVNIIYDVTFQGRTNVVARDLMPILNKYAEMGQPKYDIHIVLISSTPQRIRRQLQMRHEEMLSGPDAFIRAIPPRMIERYIEENQVGYYKIQEDARLAANAQQFGQQNVLYGAGLLGQGANAMGSYYGGQQQAYTPYTTALGQVQGLETAAQQPLTMGLALGKEASQAGARVGELGLGGARLSTALGTSANATANPYAQALMAAGNPNAMFGQSLGNVFGGLFS
jgi:hypothetical protein